MTGTTGPGMGIGEFARRARLSLKALRLYDRLGVLVPADVDERTGYRYYRESQLADARLVVALRRLDMPLADVATLLALPDGQRGALVEAYWAAVERRVASQRHLVGHLVTRLSGEERKHDMYQVQLREVPEQRVLTEQRHVPVDQLPDWIATATRRLYAAAEHLGVPAGASFVIYHGEVNEDSDGPVECCVPVHTTDELPGHAVRVEPAHREAYTRITVAQVEFPQILSAYEAVEQWTREQGHEVVGPPREVYFADLSRLGPDDSGCDIAFPVR